MIILTRVWVWLMFIKSKVFPDDLELVTLLRMNHTEVFSLLLVSASYVPLSLELALSSMETDKKLDDFLFVWYMKKKMSCFKIQVGQCILFLCLYSEHKCVDICYHICPEFKKIVISTTFKNASKIIYCHLRQLIFMILQIYPLPVRSAIFLSISLLSFWFLPPLSGQLFFLFRIFFPCTTVCSLSIHKNVLPSLHKTCYHTKVLSSFPFPELLLIWPSAIKYESDSDIFYCTCLWRFHLSQ